MANTGSQAEAIRDLLVERLELFDPSLDTSEGSALWAQVVSPVFDALGADPFDTDIRSFLKDRMTQAFPLISAQDGDAMVDLLITPLEVLLEPLKRETQIVRRGQSARHPENLRIEDARDLAANFFVDFDAGAKATGTVRVYYANPTYVTILPTLTFTTPDGVEFHPTYAQVVRPEQMSLFRSGTEYYVEVPLTAAESGDAGNVAKGTITSVKGLSGYTRITNLSDFADGRPPDTTDQLLARTRQSLTERTLNTRRGIVARVFADFPAVSEAEVVGYGDPEMNRDVVTGGGEGSVIASGVCFVVGQFVLMFSTFEDRGSDGETSVEAGNEVELNFWKFLYDVDAGSANEKFTIDTVLFDSRNSITDMPSILLFRMSSAPSVSMPIAGTLAGVLPGVFSVVRKTGVIEISDIPGGILDPDTARGTVEVEDGAIHIGGHYDVWLRTPAHTDDSATFSAVRSESALLEGSDLVVNGESDEAQHLVHRAYTVTSTTAYALDARLESGSGAVGVVALVTDNGGSRTYTMWEMNGVEFTVADSITDGTTSGTISAVSSQSWAGSGVEAGTVLSIPSGNEAGAYRVLAVEGSFLYLDAALTTTARDQFFRVLSEVTIDAFDPKAVLVPFGDALGDDLRTVIGSALLRTGVNLQDYGADVGDTLEILSGDDVGTYVIASWDTTYGGTGPTLSTAMTATNSQVQYTVYRTTQALQRPLLRVKPGGVVLLDTSGQDSGYTVPPAAPVDVRATGAFSGAKTVASGLNGFVLLDPGDGWAPSADYVVDIETFDWATWTTAGNFEDFYDEARFTRCYTDECVDGDGFIAVISVYATGQMFLDSNLPSAAQTFLQDARTWLLSVISTFNFGGDETALVNALSPLQFGPNTDDSSPLILQFEILIPFEVFDGCNNVFVALPEFDWESDFASTDTFADAVELFNSGGLAGADPALLQAVAGDVLTVMSGQNAGSYVVDSVHQYYLINAGALDVALDGTTVVLDNAYKVALVVIRGEFPVSAIQGLPDFFSSGTATWSLPSPPALPFTVLDGDSNPVEGWDFVQLALTWFFQLLTSMGFDLPESVELDVPSTLKAIWELLFCDYAVGRATAPQYLRAYFQEPTSMTVYAPQVCVRYAWAPPAHTPITAVGEDFTLPFAEFDGLGVELEVETVEGSTVLSGTMDASAASAATIEDLAAYLQTLLDANAETVVFSGPATATGALTIVTVAGGQDTFLYVTATDVEDGFRWMGFHDPAGKAPAECSSASSPAYLAAHVTVPSDAGFALTVTTTWPRLVVTTMRLTVSAVVGGPFVDDDEVSGSLGGLGFVKVDGTTLYVYSVADQNFQVGDTLSGSVSGASGTIDTFSSPSFTDGETITGVTSATVGTATLTQPNIHPSDNTYADDDVVTGPSWTARVRVESAFSLTLYDLSSAVSVGDAISGAPSGAGGVVRAVRAPMVVKDASGAFTLQELVVGSTSGTTGVVWSLETYEFTTNVEVTPGTDLTYDEVSADLETLLAAALVAYEVDDGSAAVVFDDSTGPWAYTITLGGAGVDQFAIGAPVTFEALGTSEVAALFGADIAGTGTPTGSGTEPLGFFVADLETAIFDGTSTSTALTALAYSDAVALDDAVDAAAGGDFNALAQALNLVSLAYGDGAVRLLWFVGGASLTLRSVLGGALTTITPTTAGDDNGYLLLGFDDPTVGTGTDDSGVSQGATVAGDSVTAYTHPHAPTILSTVVGAQELLFTPSLEADPFPVYPGQTEDGDVALTDLPRDLVVAAAYDGQLSVVVSFTGTDAPAPLVLGIVADADWLRVYEQRQLLALAYAPTETDTSADRVVAVFTSFGSNVITLPDFSTSGTNQFTFLAPSNAESGDQVEVGDLVFVEEGDDVGGYTVVARTATTLTLDRALTVSTERAYRYGNDGELVVDAEAKFASATAAFTSDDVGRYLTLWAMNRDAEDGSYKITAVEDDGSGCTLDTDAFAETEEDVHWMVVKSPTDTLGDSSILGRTALLGLRPIRVYDGTPAVLRVADVDPTLDRTAARVTLALTDGYVPKSGVQQPYQFVRPGVQHISSTAMRANLERGLFTFEFLAQSLGGSDLYNIPATTKLEPVFGTYDSDGYRLDVADNRYTFSTHESSAFALTPTFLPEGLDDLPSNRIALDGVSLRVDYEYVPTVAQVQGLLNSETDRVLCANALARHFLPAYVYFDLSYSGGNTAATVATAVNSYIEGLSAVDDLDVSKVEKVLHRNSVTRYDHPVVVTTLTHDLDRRVVGTRSENVISDDEIAYNGTNRTTFFVPGPDQSSVEDDADVPVGERTRLVQTTIKSTFR